MLKYKVGDLVQAAKKREVDVIAHQCNCFCDMKTGIAPKIKHAFPEVYKADLATKSGSRSKLGTFSKAVAQNGLSCYNLYGQYDFKGRSKGKVDTNYNALEKSLFNMGKDILDSDKTVKVGLPKIGAGLGGGDWKIISGLIEKNLTEKGIDVTIYVLSENDIPRMQK